MNCDEVKRRMSEGAGPHGKEVMEHIENCPSCARHAEAAHLLDRLIDDAGKDVQVEPFELVRDRVNMISNKQSAWEKFMSQIKDQFYTRPRMITGMGLAAAVLIFAVLVPFSVDHTVGYKISLTGIDAEARPSPDVINAAFAAAGLRDVYVETITGDDESGTVEELYVNTPSKKEAQQLAKAIKSSLAVEYAQVDVQPVIKAKTRSLIAQMYDKSKSDDDPPVRIRFEEGLLLINGKGVFESFKSPDLTDDEVRQKLLEVFAMEDDEETDVTVDVQTSDDGKTRIIYINAPAASLSHALSNIKLDASDRLLAVRYKGDADVPDSMKAIELSIRDNSENLLTKGIKMKIVIDMNLE